jgi:hypothetical protein
MASLIDIFSIMASVAFSVASTAIFVLEALSHLINDSFSSAMTITNCCCRFHLREAVKAMLDSILLWEIILMVFIVSIPYVIDSAYAYFKSVQNKKRIDTDDGNKSSTTTTTKTKKRQQKKAIVATSPATNPRNNLQKRLSPSVPKTSPSKARRLFDETTKAVPMNQSDPSRRLSFGGNMFLVTAKANRNETIKTKPIKKPSPCRRASVGGTVYAKPNPEATVTPAPMTRGRRRSLSAASPYTRSCHQLVLAATPTSSYD